MNYKRLKSEIKSVRNYSDRYWVPSESLRELSFLCAKHSHEAKEGGRLVIANEWMIKSLAYHVVAEQVAQ